MSLYIADNLSSTDDNALTTLVVLAHVLAIRVVVAPASLHLRVSLYPRARAVPGGDPTREHPDLDAAVEPWRDAGGNRVA